jgi:hypothetical protein
MAGGITLDELAAMVARGFEDVRREWRQGLDGVRREMREGFARIHAVVDGHTETLAAHGATLNDHSHRLDRIERKLDVTIERVDDHGVRLRRLERGRGRRA